MSSNLSLQEKKAIIHKNNCAQEKILNILVELQFSSNQGYIDQETAALVAKELGMSETRVYEVLSYYAMLKTTPQAKYVLKICNSSPCHFSKSTEVVEALEDILDINIGETTADGMFAFHYIPCVGACDIGPVIKIKDTVFGNLDRIKIEQLISDLRHDKIEL